MRLAKYLAHAGIASRRAATQLVRDGRVTVDGALELDPAHEVMDGETVEFDGRALAGAQAEVFMTGTGSTTA